MGEEASLWFIYVLFVGVVPELEEGAELLEVELTGEANSAFSSKLSLDAGENVVAHIGLEEELV